MHGHRIIVWLALTDFFCCLGLLMLSLYGQVRSALGVGVEAAQIVERIHERLRDHPAWKDRIDFNSASYSLRVPEAALFDFNSRDLRRPTDLQPLAEAIRAEGIRFREFTLIVTGHTDDYGSRPYNLTLSRDRAETVAIALHRYGLDPAEFSIATRGVGPSYPEVDNCLPASTFEKRFACLERGLPLRPKPELERNRRIELTVGIFSEALARLRALSSLPTVGAGAGDAGAGGGAATEAGSGSAPVAVAVAVAVAVSETEPVSVPVAEPNADRIRSDPNGSDPPVVPKPPRVAKVDTAALLSKGEALFAQGKIVEAVEAFSAAAFAAPDDAIAHARLGAAYAEAGENELAESSLATAVGLDPRHADSRYLLGRLLEKRGEKSAAAESYRVFLEVEPTGVRADDARRRLDALAAP